ncbi:hypothetical protein TRFO_36264 [Tritrichomonas foetus]|uniref:Uncharacterized protein n=1 Tax=Tritrichomonas foetus TaxID=1144522 RepID=A0A1J4JE80_9EUKA|nr:hypothetical protein TRFO_36264 [Tritrichomonas foetus]|eukprot:OHS97510.1 hypothetical protein TRFO_36264 [Tritrichomonas foetus]
MQTERISRDRYLFRIGLIIAAILQLIIILLYKRKSFIREHGRMPFIWNHKLNVTIKNYLSTVPSNQVLFISGPYQSGKSRILELIADFLISTKRFPFIMRADQSVTVEDLVDSIKINSLKVMQRLSQRLSPIEIQQFGALCQSKDVDHPQFSDIGMARAYDYVESVADSLLGDTKLFFDRLTRIDQSIPTCVLIFGFDRLLKMKSNNGTKLGKIIFNETYHHFRHRTQYAEYIPYVIEIMDTSMFLRKKNSDPSFIYAFTDQIENPVNMVSVQRNLFTTKETQFLVESFGGHGGSFSYVFDEMQIKRPIKQSTETLKQKLNVVLSNTIKETKSPVWYQICQSDGEIPWNHVSMNKQLILPLIKKGLLYANEDKIIKTAHPGVLNYICAIAKKPKRIPTPVPKKAKDTPKIIRKIVVTNETLNVSEIDETAVFAQEFINETQNITETTTETQTEVNIDTTTETSNEVVNETTTEDASEGVEASEKIPESEAQNATDTTKEEQNEKENVNENEGKIEGENQQGDNEIPYEEYNEKEKELETEKIENNDSQENKGEPTGEENNTSTQ